MGGLGQSKSDTTQTQQSQTQPWAPAVPFLSGVLQQLGGYGNGGLLNNTGITGTQTGALNSVENNAATAGQFAPQINNVTSSLLAGGGALGQAGNVQNAFNQFNANTAPLADNTNYDPMQTPGIGDQLQGLKDSITQNINGSFAAGGRDFSGANQKALAMGLAQGLAPVLTNQFNANRTAQQGAAGNLYSGGLQNAGILSGLQQQYLANQQAGVGSVAQGLDASNAGNNAILQAEAQRFGIPVQNLGLLANIGVPIAGLGKQSFGTGQSNTVNTASPLSDLTGLLGLSNPFKVG